MLSNGNSTLVNYLFTKLQKDQYFDLPSELKQLVADEIKGGWCNEEQCLRTINEVFARTKMLIDPHTAVAKHVADKYSPIDYKATPFTSTSASSPVSNDSDSDVPMLIMATAHWGKFPPAMLKALGHDVSDPKALDVNELASEMTKQFTTLTSLDPHPASYLHPELVKLTQKPVAHYNTIEADQRIIVERIKEFFRSYAAASSSSASAETEVLTSVSDNKENINPNVFNQHQQQDRDRHVAEKQYSHVIQKV